MNKRFLFWCLITGLCLNSCKTTKIKNSTSMEKFITVFEENENQTTTYPETITYFESLAEEFSEITLTPTGMTDAGYPLHEVVISKDKIKTPQQALNQGKLILFVNNAIHPGEPCGVDASMMLARDLVTNSEMSKLLEEVVVVIVPFYNIGGGLNRSGYSRANQVGPEAYGFRGNAKNLDLNRDFVKCDSKNAVTFNRLFTKWNPHVFIDNHTSNGADYQYVMTLIATQKDKLSPALSKHMTTKMLPELYDAMEKDRYEMTPYVNARSTPDEGIAAFLDLPRYSSGYAVLHNVISFMPETHMLKPYKDRVLSTYDFMKHMLIHMNGNKSEILKAKMEDEVLSKTKTSYDLNWKLDFSNSEALTFKGYEAKYKPSMVTGQSRLYYDRDAPFEKKIPFYNTYTPSLTIQKPKAYIIPQAYSEIIDRMENNGVKVNRLPEDERFNIERYYIKSFETVDQPYEGHYLHYNVEVEAKPEQANFYRGDYIIQTGQSKDRYIVETLEPQAPDAFFAWNFFDGIMMQKEYFSSYVFEDTAARMLNQDPMLRAAFEKKKRDDAKFAEDARAQLRFIYESSPYYEKTHKRYPVGRVMN